MWITEKLEYKIKWTISNYYISDNNIIFNKNNKQIKQTTKDKIIGYYINGRFRSLKYIRENCKLYKEEYLPF